MLGKLIGLLPLFLFSFSAFSQGEISLNNYRDTGFHYQRIDTSFLDNSVKQIRYRDIDARSEYFIDQGRDGVVETGYRKNGLFVGKWIRFDGNGRLIKSLDFDTLLIRADGIMRIAIQNGYDPVVDDIDYRFDDLWPGEQMENYWLVTETIDDELSYSTVVQGISVNARTGRKYSYYSPVLYQPAIYYDSLNTRPVFDEKYGSLDFFIAENSRYPVAKGRRSKNVAMVQFEVAADGKIGRIHSVSATTGFFKREACRLVGLMPDWRPAKRDGKVAACSYTLMLNFQ